MAHVFNHAMLYVSLGLIEKNNISISFDFMRFHMYIMEIIQRQNYGIYSSVTYHCHDY